MRTSAFRFRPTAGHTPRSLLRTLASTAARARVAAGFTLVELLIVIGIIALLISILLPALNAAREQARSAACLSNLHQLGISHTNYISESGGYILPTDYRDSTTAAGANGYAVADTWATVLVASKYL